MKEAARQRRLAGAKSKFEYWIFEFGGPIVLGEAIGVSDKAIYNWLARKSHPSLIYLLRIQKLAPHLTLKDIAKGVLA